MTSSSCAPLTDIFLFFSFEFQRGVHKSRLDVSSVMVKAILFPKKIKIKNVKILLLWSGRKTHNSPDFTGIGEKLTDLLVLPSPLILWFHFSPTVEPFWLHRGFSASNFLSCKTETLTLQKKVFFWQQSTAGQVINTQEREGERKSRNKS